MQVRCDGWESKQRKIVKGEWTGYNKLGEKLCPKCLCEQEPEKWVKSDLLQRSCSYCEFKYTLKLIPSELELELDEEVFRAFTLFD